MVTTITENKDGSGSSKKVENLEDGSSITTELKIDGKGSGANYNLSFGGWNAILDDWQNKRAKKKELKRMTDVIDNLEEEKSDDYRTPSYNFHDSVVDFFFGDSGKAVQGGFVQPPLSAQDQAIFDQAKKQREISGYGGPGTSPGPGSNWASQGTGRVREENLFRQDADAMQYAYAGPGTTPSTSGPALRGEELAEKLSPVTKEIIETAAQELDEAGNDQAAREGVFENVKEGLMDFAEMNPQLAKSILSTIAAMVMGASFGDAIATGFGVHEEAAMKEEAENKAASQEVVAMLIENAEYINDENFWKTLAAYGITEDSEAGQLIATKWDIARDVASKKKFETNLAKELEKIDKLYEEVTNRHVTTKNQAYVYDAITRFIPYAKEQLRNSKTPSFITDENTKSGIVSAIAEYTRQVDEALENGYYDRAASLRQQGIEAIWEGMQGSFQFIDGKLESSVIIPPDKAGLLHAQRIIMGTMWEGDTKKSQEFEATVYAEWIKDYFGKKGKFNKEDDFVDFLAMRVGERLQEENE
jgi:hypothetical protein